MAKLHLFLLLTAQLAAQNAQIRSAPYLAYPSSVVDGNSPGLWVDGRLKVYTSTGDLLKMSGDNLQSLYMDVPPLIDSAAHHPMWIESIWRDPGDGVVYAWYHHEPGGYCPGRGLTVPRIGALVSHDGGDTFEDLGIVLSSGDDPIVMPKTASSPAATATSPSSSIPRASSFTSFSITTAARLARKASPSRASLLITGPTPSATFTNTIRANGSKRASAAE